MTDYKPIDCNYYDVLILYAMHKDQVFVTYENDDGDQQTVQAVILDLFTKQKEEFMRLSSGIVIRLDRVLSVSKI